MSTPEKEDYVSVSDKIARWNERVAAAKNAGIYPYMRTIRKMDGMEMDIEGRCVLQFASYSYLNLLGHPEINQAAKKAVEDFGTGTHGVRFLSGTTQVHMALEEKIAAFKQTESAIAVASGYAANFGTIAALLGRSDTVISDGLNHASIVDGCVLSRAKFVRIDHNDMAALEEALAKASSNGTKLVVTDAVFSMDGDIINLPEVIKLCKKYKALLMVDEAHSLGVIGKTGHGIEEHFGIDPKEGLIDIKMGTLSKTIPSVGGYIAGNTKLITFLKHSIRPFIFSAALPPASAAAAKAALDVIENEPERVKKLHKNADYFHRELKKNGFDTLNSQTAIVPIVVGNEMKAFAMTKIAFDAGIFIVPILPPAVPKKTIRIRATVTAGHTSEQIDRAVAVFAAAAKTLHIAKVT